MYAEVKARNASVADGTIGKAIGSKCGANFTCESAAFLLSCFVWGSVFSGWSC